MRNFAYKNPDYIKNDVVPELVEGNPCYQASVYDTVMYDESPDGDLIQSDMTQILLNQEKYRQLLGDMNVQDILAQMHPTQSTVMDNMTDEERFNCVQKLPYCNKRLLHSVESPQMYIVQSTDVLVIDTGRISVVTLIVKFVGMAIELLE